MVLFKVPVQVYVRAESAEDALAAVAEECDYLAVCDSAMTSFEFPETPQDVEEVQEEEGAA